MVYTKGQNTISKIKQLLSKLKNTDADSNQKKLINDLTSQLNILEKAQQELVDHNVGLSSEIKAKEDQITETQKNAELGNWNWSLETNTFQISPALINILGLKKKSNFNYTIYDVLESIHKEDLNQVNHVVKEAIRGKKINDFTCRIINTKNQVKHIKTSILLKRNSKGKVTKIYGTTQDITALVKSEEKLKLLNQDLITGIDSRTRDLQRALRAYEKEIDERKLLELDLKLERNKLNSYLDVMEAILVVIDDAARVSLINKKGAEVLGYKQHNIVGKNWYNLAIPKKESAKLKKIFSEIKKGNITKFGINENHILSKTGEERLILWKNSLLKDGKKVVGMVSFGLDITELREAELKQKQLSNLVKNSNDAIIGIDLQGKIQNWNNGAKKMYGFSLNEIKNESFDEILVIDKEIKIQDLIPKVKKGKTIEPFQTRRKTKSGEIIDISVSISPFFDIKKNLAGISTIERNITEQKKLQRRFELAVEATPNSMIMINEAGKIVMTNTKARKLFGYKEKDFVGQPLNILFPKDNQELDIQDVINGTVFQTEMLHLQHANGFEIPCELGLNTIHADDGTFILASVIDLREKIKFEKEKNENELKYQTLVENMNEGVLIFNSDDVIQFVNKKFKEIINKTEDENLIGLPVTQLFPPKYKSKMSLYNIRTTKGKSSKFEFQIATGTAEKKWISVNISPMYGKDGVVIGSIGLYSDTTERKLYEETINSIARFSDENPNPVMRFSHHGQILMYVNKAGSNFIKYLDKKSNENVKEQWENKLNKTFDSGITNIVEIEIENTIYMCTLVPIIAEEYINVYASDITAIRKAQDEIKRLSYILNKTNNAITIANINGRIEWVNEGFVELTQYTINDVLGTSAEMLRKENTSGLSKDSKYFKKVIQQKKPVHYEARNIKKDGTPYWVYTTLSPIVNDSGDVIKVVSIDSDITKIKEAEQQLIKAKNLAEDSARSKENFLANMSHEIRTPMNAIMGMVQLLNKTRLSKTQREYITSINYAGDNLIGIINDILDISKIESKKIELEQIDFNLHKVISELQKTYIYRAQEQSIDLFIEIDDNIPRGLKGDPLRLNQVLTNLVGNAIKFTEKGSVTIKAELLRQRTDKSLVRLAVSDTGIGISAKNIDKIFKPFTQADSNTTRKYGGSGLGLTIVKHIVELYKSKLNIISAPKKGTTFEFDIWFNHASKESSKKKTVKSNGDSTQMRKMLNQKKVLLVEDNELNQMVATSFLKNLGLKIDVVENGKLAVDKLTDSNYDLVLMDIQMPEMDGYQATKHIRTKLNNDNTDVPILAMTAHAFKGEFEKCINAGMNDYISKPIKKDLLIEKIVALINNNLQPHV